MHVSLDVALATVGLGVLLGALAASVPARGMLARDIVQGLRKLGWRAFSQPGAVR